MEKHVELAVTSDEVGNINVWNHETGASLKTFKGISNGPHTLLLINEYLMSAQRDKPLLNFWNLATTDQVHQKMVTPGRINALTISPDFNYCAAAIEEKIYIWMTFTGNLLATICEHYQPITCLKFTLDGCNLISASEDTRILAWNLSDVFTKDILLAKPMRQWPHHSAVITDLYVSCGTRFATVSVDQTCRLFDLLSEIPLLSIVFDVTLSAVTMDAAETHLFVGADDGRIFQVNLFEAPRTLETHMEETQQSIFEGHTKKVTSLSVSMDGSLLLSGSHDNTAKIWHVHSRHCLVTLDHKGLVTNTFFTTSVDSLTSSSNHKKMTLPLQTFKRNVQRENTVGTIPILISKDQPHSLPYSSDDESDHNPCVSEE